MKIVLCFFLWITLITACDNQSADNKNSSADTIEITDAGLTELPADFRDFYQKFHADSLYQTSRIMFPLEGLPTTDEGPGIVNGRYYHARENWRMHRPMQDNSGFVRKTRIVSEDLIEEVMADEKGLFGMKRRFAKFDGEWYLIFYSGMNHIAQEIQ